MTTETQSVESKIQDYPGWYKRLFAWLMAHGTAKYEAQMADQKQALFSNLHGNVLEIGPGTGPNLSYYPPDIHWIGIEPNPFMHSYLRREAERLGLDIDLRPGTAERLDVEDNSIDAVVSTLVLCSVDNLAVTLQEVLRVLKPGGRFFFLEHVAAPQGTGLRRVQHWVQPLWKILGDGCRPDRETWVALEEAGFERVDYQHFRADIPAIVSPQIIGVATKKA
ncbi:MULTISPECIES: class I SAM-dependent methyltransferase [unclassified Coleofasciculus]|uniref:class I SAM-dependent methyltransferase n=1 Tax=unclassified Coleofasciculus TaxID=2692782 RepID=UPI0018803238|nr:MULTISPECIES: class I SAM-dependent methyltransferase [unclassified Coleofasciculus]MBE9129603.1 class I SAM-dependent methyltransferase [Coleofasciculus sp. LEGE 07081]MBE9151353.1 class I SAM-dependent methyltransferase [Coleofasciculus sp. LEGE 07092]